MEFIEILIKIILNNKLLIICYYDYVYVFMLKSVYTFISNSGNSLMSINTFLSKFH